MGFAALLQAVAGLLPAPQPALPPLRPREKAALVVVSALPAPPGVAGVFLHPGESPQAAPPGALVFADQEGGLARAFPDLPPAAPASAYGTVAEALAAGRATGRALRQVGVDVDLAPVLDLNSGPLGSRHFRRPALGLAFARGLARAGTRACVKHFPGLGSAPVSTDASPRVHARVVLAELAAFRAAIRAGVACVMTSHALYGRLGGRASLRAASYRLLRRLGFRGVAITDSLDIAGSEYAVPWALLAARHGADLLLFTNGRDAARAIRALVPLARSGALDDQVARVLALRHATGIGSP